MADSRFAAMLDEAMRRATPKPVIATAAAWSRWPGAQPVSPFLRMAPLNAAAPRWTLAEGAPVRRQAPRLTAEQQHAFERFEAPGRPSAGRVHGRRAAPRVSPAGLPFHPDRHADRSALEREQRARNFAEAAELYRCLREVIEPRH